MNRIDEIQKEIEAIEARKKRYEPIFTKDYYYALAIVICGPLIISFVLSLWDSWVYWFSLYSFLSASALVTKRKYLLMKREEWEDED